MMAGCSVMQQVLDILVGEVTHETCLLIFDFLGHVGIVVVEGRGVNELLVEDGLEEELEVAHEAGVVTVSVLSEDGEKSVVDLSSLLVLLWLSRELGEADDACDKTEPVDEADNTMLERKGS